jgi:hypothetical protein
VSTPTPSGPEPAPQPPGEGSEQEYEHIVRDEDPDTALCGVDQAGVPWNQGFPICGACLAVAETELADLARDEIARRFAEQHPEIGAGTCVATFTCPSRALGDVLVEVEGEGVVVYVVDMWHGHFDDGTPEEIVAECAHFLDDLFHDRVVVYVARRGGRVLGGGTFYPGVPAPSWRSGVSRELSRKADEVRAGTWSAPWVDDGIDEDAETALADLGRVEIARRFAEQRPEIGEGFRVARFTCRSRSLGDVVVEAQGTCLRMGIVGMPHRYFDEGTPEEIVAECAAFLDDLFHDEILVYRATKGTRLLNFGFTNRDDRAEFLRRLNEEADDLRAGTWSRRWEDDGISDQG